MTHKELCWLTSELCYQRFGAGISNVCTFIFGAGSFVVVVAHLELWWLLFEMGSF